MNKYFQKYGFKPIQLNQSASINTGLIVVIPCFNEKEIIKTLNSLNNCPKPTCELEVIIVVNQSEVIGEDIKIQNELTVNQINEWIESNNSFFTLFVLYEESLPKKHAGVGLARKIGMDEAAMRFNSIDKDGIIVCLDADCTVEENYFIEIENHFTKYPKTPGCSIKYAHPIVGNDFDDYYYEGILNYELFLRYYNLALKHCGVPYAFHTVGSSMAVKSSAYQKQGGMNKRKAGEDFYFLQKIIELGGFTELNLTTVFPSPRTSDRVPFGTGKAINDFLNQENKEEYLTYNFNSFLILKDLFLDTKSYYLSKEYLFKHKALVQFNKELGFETKIEEIKANTTNLESFTKRFFKFFNAFTVLKYVHFTRDNYFENKEIKSQVVELLLVLTGNDFSCLTKHELLLKLREIENSI